MVIILSPKLLSKNQYLTVKVKGLNPGVPSMKIQEESQISFCKILKNKWYRVKVLLKRFRLNDYTIGFRPQTQYLGLQYILYVSIIIDSGSEKRL